MNSKDWDRDRWAHLTPTERNRLRKTYRSYRRILGLDPIIANCVLSIEVVHLQWALQDRGVWHA